MSEEIKQDIIKTLTPKNSYRNVTYTSGTIKYFLEQDGRKVPQSQVDKALKALMEEGIVVATKGRDIPWRFRDKRPDSTYYTTVEYRTAQLKELEEAADARRWQRAADEADLSLRQLHPKEWDALKAKFYKELTDKEYKG